MRCECGGYWLFAFRRVCLLGVFGLLSPSVDVSSGRGDSVVYDCTKRVIGGVEIIWVDG